MLKDFENILSHFNLEIYISQTCGFVYVSHCNSKSATSTTWHWLFCKSIRILLLFWILLPASFQHNFLFLFQKYTNMLTEQRLKAGFLSSHNTEVVTSDSPSTGLAPLTDAFFFFGQFVIILLLFGVINLNKLKCGQWLFQSSYCFSLTAATSLHLLQI